MIPVHAAREPHDGAPGVCVPMGRAEPHERRYHIAAAGVRHTARAFFRFRRAPDELELIPQPLDRRACHEDRAFERIIHAAFHAPGDGRHKAVAGGDGRAACVHQQEAARAVGVLYFARSEAGLPEERRLLIARRPCDGDGRAEERRIRLAVNAA